VKSYVRRLGVVGLVALTGLFPAGSAGTVAAGEKHIAFDMVPSAAATNGNCLQDATARVTIDSKGSVEHMDVHVSGLPPNTEFDFFVIQLPNAPFGLAWYQGDIETNHEGRGHQKFIGRFNIETFIRRAAPGRPKSTDRARPAALPGCAGVLPICREYWGALQWARWAVVSHPGLPCPSPERQGHCAEKPPLAPKPTHRQHVLALTAQSPGPGIIDATSGGLRGTSWSR